MSMKKTRKEMFEMIIEVMGTVEHAEKAEMVEFLEHQLEMVADRKARSGKASEKKKAETLVLAEKVLEVMKGKSPMTATQIYKECEKADIAEVTSSQKVVSLMKALGEEKVVRTIEKKTALFSVV